MIEIRFGTIIWCYVETCDLGGLLKKDLQIVKNK